MAAIRAGRSCRRRSTPRRPVFTVLLLILGLVAASCGSSGLSLGPGDPEATAITFALDVQQDEARAIAELIDRFERASEGRISVELIARFRDRPRNVNLATVNAADMRTALREKKPRIHLFAQDNVALADLVSEELVQDVSDVPLDAGVTSPLPEEFEEKRFFLPFRPNVRLAYVHRERLPEGGVDLPRTPEELKHVARRLRDLAGHPVLTLSLSDKEGGRPAAVTISELVLAFGGDPVRVNSEEAVKAFEFLQSLEQEGLLTRESWFAKHDTEIDYLKDGTSWLAQNWSVTSAELADEGRLDEFHVYPGWQGAGGHVIGGDVLGIPAGVTGAERAAAVDLARFLMTKEAQRFLVERNAWPAIRDDAYEPSATRDATIGAMKEALARRWYRPPKPYWSAVTAAMNEAVERIVRQGQPVRPVLDELHAG